MSVRSEEEALWPVINALGGEVAEYYEGVGTGCSKLLIYSTPVKCLAVRMWVVDVSEEDGGSDKFLM